MNPFKNALLKTIVVASIVFYVDSANAVEFEKLGTAVGKALGTTKAFRAPANLSEKSADIFFSKDAKGQPDKVAFVQKRVYEPNCTHTWVIGLDAKTQAVEQIRVVEMSCPHAFPTKENSFLKQFFGKGPADLKKLKKDVQTIAKATGSSELTTDAVWVSIEAATHLKGKI